MKQKKENFQQVQNVLESTEIPLKESNKSILLLL